MFLGSAFKSLAFKALPCLAWALLTGAAIAQDRLPNMPRYDRYQKLRDKIGGSVTGGTVRVDWAKDGKSFEFLKGDKSLRFDIATGVAGKSASTGSFDTGDEPRPMRGRLTPGRGRQAATAFSEDGKWQATCKDRNVFIGPADSESLTQITTDGSVAKRIKYGMASWVYGEEFRQQEAMWWSPDGKKLAFYRFDESLVPDYFVTNSETSVQNRLETEAYPKAGAPNPAVDIRIYDIDAKTTTTVDAHFKSEGVPDLGHYLCGPRWSADGKSLLFFRMNRKQNHLEYCAADASTGACRTLFSESNPTGWVTYRPSFGRSWLWSDPGDGVLWKGASASDSERFLWISERDGYRNLYLYDLSGRLIKQLTANAFDAQQVVKVDKAKGIIWYSAHDGGNPYLVQVHRVSLSGKDKRLTDAAFSHAVQLSPDGEHFVDVAQTLMDPPRTSLCDAEGRVLGILAVSDTSKFENLGLRKAERFKFKAADGKTDLYGHLMFPSDFDPAKKYPLLVNTYAGPESGTVAEGFKTPDPFTEFGFIVAWIDGRGTQSRGREFRQSVYRKLGIVDVDDQAAGVKFLGTLPYVDGSRVGIEGASYGGYMSLMALLRYPELFAAACASSAVTDWHNYNSTYTERYMDLPEDNQDGYSAGSTKALTKNLKGDLLLYFGTADDNVHPSNTIQLVQALASSGKRFEMTLGPDQGHSTVSRPRMWEFFIEHLILNPKPTLVGP